MRRAVWSELVPYQELVKGEVLRLLSDRALGLYLAVTPDRAAEVAEVIRACRDHGIEVALWPMLSHTLGRWPSVHNAEAFATFTLALIDDLEARGLSPRGIALDLEPPIEELPGLLRLDGRAIRRRFRPPPPASVAELAKLRATLDDRGLEPFVAAFPFVVSDGRSGGWQRFLGTPVDALGARRVTTMIYTSMIEGYARGHLARRDVVALLSGWASAMVDRYEAPSVSLGCVAHGILGDEPRYRAPSELSADVAASRAAGIDDLVLFSLCGALSRPPAEAWLDAFVHTEAAAVPMTARALAILGAVRAASLAFGVRAPLFRPR